jgi:predicted metalloprotease with PDZ domain
MSSKKIVPAVHYSVDASQTHSHLFKVSLHIVAPQAGQVVSLPVWIPGSYLVREFAKNLQSLKATHGGKAVAIHQDHKSQWHIQCKEGQDLQLSYEVYAFDNSVRSAWLDTQRGFFNGTSLCLRVHGQEERAHALTLTAIKGSSWLAATGLQATKVNKQGFGDYVAANYDELVRRPEQFYRSLMRIEIPPQIFRLVQQFSLIPVVQCSLAIYRAISSCCAFQTKLQLRSLLELAG